MFASSGYFRGIQCPFFDNGLCERHYCHFRHARQDGVQAKTLDAVKNLSAVSDNGDVTAALLPSQSFIGMVGSALRLVQREGVPGRAVARSAACSYKPTPICSKAATKPPVKAAVALYKPTPLNVLRKLHAAQQRDVADNASTLEYDPLTNFSTLGSSHETAVNPPRGGVKRKTDDVDGPKLKRAKPAAEDGAEIEAAFSDDDECPTSKTAVAVGKRECRPSDDKSAKVNEKTGSGQVVVADVDHSKGDANSRSVRNTSDSEKDADRRKGTESVQEPERKNVDDNKGTATAQDARQNANNNVRIAETAGEKPAASKDTVETDGSKDGGDLKIDQKTTDSAKTIDRGRAVAVIVSEKSVTNEHSNRPMELQKAESSKSVPPQAEPSGRSLFDVIQTIVKEAPVKKVAGAVGGTGKSSKQSINDVVPNSVSDGSLMRRLKKGTCATGVACNGVKRELVESESRENVSECRSTKTAPILASTVAANDTDGEAKRKSDADNERETPVIPDKAKKESVDAHHKSSKSLHKVASHGAGHVKGSSENKSHRHSSSHSTNSHGSSRRKSLSHAATSEEHRSSSGGSHKHRSSHHSRKSKEPVSASHPAASACSSKKSSENGAAAQKSGASNAAGEKLGQSEHKGSSSSSPSSSSSSKHRSRHDRRSVVDKRRRASPEKHRHRRKGKPTAPTVSGADSAHVSTSALFGNDSDSDAKTTTDRGMKTTADRGVKTTAGRGVKTTADRGVKTTADRGVKTTADRGVKTTGDRGVKTTADRGRVIEISDDSDCPNLLPFAGYPDLPSDTLPDLSSDDESFADTLFPLAGIPDCYSDTLPQVSSDDESFADFVNKKVKLEDETEIGTKRLAHSGSTEAGRRCRPVARAPVCPTPAQVMQNRLKQMLDRRTKAQQVDSKPPLGTSMGGSRSAVRAKAAPSVPPAAPPPTPEPGSGETQRTAHTPKQKDLPRPFIAAEFGDKVATNIRSRYLNLMIDESLKIYPTKQDAYDRALAEEKAVYQRCSGRKIYLNLCVNVIKKLRTETSGDGGGGRGGGAVPALTCSHAAMLGGAKAAQTSFSLKRRPSGAAVTPQTFSGTDLYKRLCKYLVTDEDLFNNGFPRSTDGTVSFKIPDKVKVDKANPERKLCCRCGKPFVVFTKGQYAKMEECVYHWGKSWKKKMAGSIENRYTCCEGDLNTVGCAVAKFHVQDRNKYTDTQGYISTLPVSPPPDGDYGVYSMDCEMIYTTKGSELARVTVIGADLETVYEKIVKPDHKIVDYNTRFSGLTTDNMKGATTTLRDVQAKLMKMFTDKTILIGHSLESDLLALKLVHNTVVDTSVVFPHRLGPPYKRALRTLMAEILQKIIQNDVGGHDSKEDAEACMQLMMWKLREDAKTQGRHS